MELCVAIVSWNTRDLLRACLQSVYRCMGDLTFEVVVVDNASADGSPDMVTTEFPAARVIRNPDNRGFARATNQAISVTTAQYVLLLNSDALLVEGSAPLMVKFLDTHPTVGGVGGKILNPDGSFQSSFASFPGLLDETLLLTGLSRWLLPPQYPSAPEKRSRDRRVVDWVGGAFLMVRRQTIDHVGALDPDYFMYAEEMDWCYRIKQHGWTLVYLPEAQAIHSSGGSSQRVPERKRSQLYHSKWLFMRKHRGWPRATAYRLLVRGISTLKMLAWTWAAASATAARRERANEQVKSYRFLLETL